MPQSVKQVLEKAPRDQDRKWSSDTLRSLRMIPASGESL
jgi:hypothetical protein